MDRGSDRRKKPNLFSCEVVSHPSVYIHLWGFDRRPTEVRM